MTGALISQPIYGIVIEFITALLFGLLVIAFAPLFGPVTLVALGAVFATALIGTSWYFYAQHRQLIDFTYPLMSTTAIYLTLIFSSFVREQAQRKQIRAAFCAVYVAGAGRTAGAVAGKARAWWRRARDDDHVLRRARLHHDLGDPTSTIRRA